MNIYGHKSWICWKLRSHCAGAERLDLGGNRLYVIRIGQLELQRDMGLYKLIKVDCGRNFSGR